VVGYELSSGKKTENLSIEKTTSHTKSGRMAPLMLPFSYIERDDFMEEPMKKFFRLGPGLMVR
jgi:glutaminyl-tRNA synthetase